MKKNIFTLSTLAVAALALFSCAKEAKNLETLEPADVQETPATVSEGIPFEIVAGTPETKTTNDGMNTKWAEGDGIILFHAAPATTEAPEYVNDGQFTASAAGTSASFTGTLASELTADSYDWYAFYPYTSQIATPANTSGGYVTIGSYYSSAQTQNGNSNLSHLAGKNYPIAGRAMGVEKAATPVISMNQLSSVVAVQVTNGTDAPVTVSSVSFTGTEGIIGHFYIDFTTDSAIYNERSASYVSNVAQLNVTGGDPISAGENAVFYLAVKPFTAHAGETITLSVTTENGEQEKTSAALTSDFSFLAGKIHQLSFNYTKAATQVAEPTGTGWYRVEQASWLAAGDRVIIVSAGGDYAMSTNQKTNNRGATAVTVSDEGNYKKIASLEDAVQTFVLETGSATGSFAFKCENGDLAGKYIYAASSSANYLKTEAQETPASDANASFVASLTEGVGTLTAQGSNTRKVMQYNPNSGNPMFACYASASQTGVSIFKYYEGTDDREEAGMSWSAESATATISDTGIDFDAPSLILGNAYGVTYHSTDTAVATIDSEGEVTILAEGETTIQAIFAGDEDYKPATVGYVLTVTDNSTSVPPVNYDFESIAALNALVTSTSSSYKGYLTNAVVSFVPAANVAIVKDATGSVMIYKSSHGLLQGQTYTGEITVTAIMYTNKNNVSQYSEVTAWDVDFTGSEAAVDPESVALSALAGHYSEYQNAYVSVSGLTVSSISGKNINVTDGTNTYVVYYNPDGTIPCVAEDVITAVGTITKYGTTEELKVWNADYITVTSSAPKAVTFSQPTQEGCSIAVSVGGEAITSGTTVPSGTTVTLTATAGDGFEFGGWTVSGATVADESAATTTFVMGTAPVSISASFTSGDEPTSSSVTYTQTYSGTGHSVAVSGTAPTGSSCSWTTTYTNSNQLTKDKSMTYTITGFDGKTITGLTLHLKTNSKAGKGTVSMKHGTTEFGSYSIPVIGSTYSTKDATVTSTVIGTGESVTVEITASENSVYCDYITITYN